MISPGTFFVLLNHHIFLLEDTKEPEKSSLIPSKKIEIFFSDFLLSY